MAENRALGTLGRVPQPQPGDVSPGDVSPGGTRHFDSDAWGWQPLWVTADQIPVVARSRFDLEVTGSPHLLGEGMLNQSWLLPCADHDRVLRVGRVERSADQVRYEHHAATIWAAVAPVVVSEHEEVPVLDGHTLTLFPFVAGNSGVRVEPAARTRAMVPVVAAMHRAALEAGQSQRPGFHAVDEHPRWFGWQEARQAVMTRFGTGPAVMKPLTVIDRATAELDEQLDGWRNAGRLDLRATVHGDLNPRNQLYRDGLLVGVIDTDDCRLEPLIWDVAGLAYSSPDVRPTDVWSCYQEAGGPLPAEDEDLLLPFARIGSLTAIMWMLDGDRPGEGAATHLALDHVQDLAGELEAARPSRDD